MANRLANETSPYLLQHKDNPVDWFPWGEEAFARAREDNKPLLVSIGYSACHWCHVMERESFEDQGTAELMNELFVNVKVDREERPDVDDVYMSAVQAMSGSGGWPMTVFLTPEGKPFFAGTYFPKEDHRGMPSFGRVLRGVANAWDEQRDQVMAQADEITAAIGREVPAEAGPITSEHLQASYEQLTASMDRRHGGFGGAPKFPQVPSLEFLLRVMHESWAPEAADLLRLTLDRMAAGGIYDHLGGGFARYATDQIWLVPHFEKMLYDNALLAHLYLRASQELGSDVYAMVARETLDYILRDLSVEGGGLASAEDADSEGVEGKFYVFDHSEFEEVVGNDADLVGEVLGVTGAGNFEGSNILHLAEPLAEVAEKYGLGESDVAATVTAAKQKLLAVRDKRVRPGLDDKVITAWNGLALRALAEAGAVWKDERYLAAARDNARFVLSELRLDDGRLLRSYRAGKAQVPAFLEDYAAYAVGLFTLYQASGEVEWYEAALELTVAIIDLFWEDDRFYATGRDAEQLITRPTDLMDNPSPSGNSLAAEALLMAALYTGDPDLFERAEAAMRAGAALAGRYPSAVGHLLAVAHSWQRPPKEVAIVGSDAGNLVDVVWERYRPALVLATDPGDGSGLAVPLLSGRTPHDGPALAYVCERFVCQAPVKTAQELSSQLT